MHQLDHTVTEQLRTMARIGETPSQMFKTLKQRLGLETPIVTILHYFQAAFCLSLGEVKPIAALSRNARREVKDEAFLDELVQPAIQQHQGEWDILPGERQIG